jgi:hypothetical protein
MPSVVLYLVHEPQLKDLFERAQNWPEHAQARLVQVALEIETDLSGAASPVPTNCVQSTKPTKAASPPRMRFGMHSRLSAVHEARIFNTSCG